jgi:hypothetical protein
MEPVERLNQPPIPSLGVWKEGFYRTRKNCFLEAALRVEKTLPNNHA